MVRRITFITLLLCVAAITFAQQKVKIDIDGSQSKPKCSEFVEESENKLIISELISGIELVEKKTKDGSYVHIKADGLYKTYDAGKPDLPVISRLIEIPANCDVKVKLLFSDEQIIELKDYGVDKQIGPAQASVSKSQDEKDLPFEKDKAVYSKDEFYKNDAVKFVDKGYLRKKHLGYIEISPFAYNPITNTLKVLYNIDVEITFVLKKNVDSQDLGRLNSPYYDNINYNTINTVDRSKELISGPVKYVIVSDRMFEETLEPFVEWKTMKGFNVIEAYTDEVGTTLTEIKDYLKDLYDNPDDGVSPTFVLFVGDVAQIPTFGSSSSAYDHATDLYYCEYTGDKLPEVYYGRFSAETVEELQPQIDKTLEVEKYEMPDPSYLDNVILVAGVDHSYASVHGNGALNYANNNYTNTENGITSYYYKYNNSSGVMSSNNPEASASIRSYINQGVSFTNYTAHCNYDGWSDPSFKLNHIDDLTNEHMYPLMVGNCCLSNKFDSNDCFGEKIVMAQNKGVVGYIGGSNSTYWDEDYWWAIGLTSIIDVSPTYENSGLGAYDRLFHSNGEAKEDWYITQGQVSVAGNLAVEASSSMKKTYYWEIYHLMGDPSLTPYVTVPSVLVASYDAQIVVGWSSLSVTAEENAYVAISIDGVLLDAKIVDETGFVEFNVESIVTPGVIDIVITKQNRQPIIDQITVIPATTPYVIFDEVIIDDSEENNNNEIEYSETVKLDMQLKNLSEEFDAFEVTAILRSLDTNIILIDSLETFGTILTEETVLVEASFIVEFKNKFQDQQVVDFDLIVIGKDSEDVEYEWISNFTVNVNAPELEFGDFWIENDDNGNSILDPGETGDLFLIVKNNGHAFIEGLICTTDASSDMTFNSIDFPYELDALSNDTIKCNVSVLADIPIETVFPIGFQINAVDYDLYYAQLVDKEIIIGEIPVILITDDDTDILTTSLFYDSGGPDGKYGSDEYEDITIRSGIPGKKLSVNFIEFDTENNTYAGGCYDHIDIFDGEDLSTLNLIGEYCNEEPPTIITSTNEAGALTFRFNSDGTVQFDGWEAELSLVDIRYDVKFIVVGPDDNAIDNAEVGFNNETKYTDADGEILFAEILPENDMPYLVTKDGYEDLNGTISVVDEGLVITAKLTLTIGIPMLKVEDLKIYPNPSNGVFYIEFDNPRNETCQVKVYDIMGSVIYNKQLKGSSVKDNINISEKAKGIYFMSVELDSGSVSKRIIIK